MKIFQKLEMYFTRDRHAQKYPIKTNQTWNQRSNLFMIKQFYFTW